MFAAVALGVLYLRDAGPFASGGRRDTTSGPGWEASVGPQGGRFVVEGIPELAGVQIVVPAGAVVGDVTLRAGFAPDLATATPLDRARDDLAWDAAIHDALIEAGLPPSLFSGMIANGSRPTGVAMRLEPSGSAFQQPIEIVVPLTTMGVDTDANLFGMVQSDDGTWELVRSTAIDSETGAATFELSHFSVLSIYHTLVDLALVPVDAVAQRLGAEQLSRYLSNFLHNPTASADLEQFAAAYRQLTNTDEWDFYEAIYCTGIAPRTTATAIPDLTTLGMSLGFESSRIQSEGAQLEAGLTEWVTARDALVRRIASGGQNGVVPPLPLADVFGKAYELSGGDVFLSLAVVHNVLRDNRNKPTVHTVLQDIRPDQISELEQNGARYHLFGTALYGFGYAYWRSAGGSPGIDWSPTTLSRIEEAWISGDIRTDVMEYAVDARGAFLGQNLYRFLRRVEANDPEYDLESFFRPSDCGRLNADGPLVDMAGADSSFLGTNEMHLSFSTETGELTGTYTLDISFPLDFVAGAVAGAAGVVGDLFCAGGTLGTGDCESEDASATDEITGLSGCVVRTRYSAEITGLYLPSTGAIAAIAMPDVIPTLEGDCGSAETAQEGMDRYEETLVSQLPESIAFEGAFDQSTGEVRSTLTLPLLDADVSPVLPVTPAGLPR